MLYSAPLSECLGLNLRLSSRLKTFTLEAGALGQGKGSWQAGWLMKQLWSGRVVDLERCSFLESAQVAVSVTHSLE